MKKSEENIFIFGLLADEVVKLKAADIIQELIMNQMLTLKKSYRYAFV
ncbi:MAG: glycogen/starch/alpha-glucan phosphorylase [Ignavibacteriales bacterium]|nr:glycogen/starch/alpha-glucan phosphorylase [Ignavibacteriales bacterium]